MSANLLIEIGTEELPPKALNELSYAFLSNVRESLKDIGIDDEGYDVFATPRRLAMLLKNIPESQPDQNIEKKGPSLKAAFDADGKPTKAVEGFARSCGVTVDQLEQQETDKGTWLVFKAEEKGKPISDLLPPIVEAALAKLPIPKRMRWGSGNVEFVRPVHWVVLMHGKDVFDCEVLGVKSSNTTQGHRFHSSGKLKLSSADKYEELLKSKGFVIADMRERENKIREQVEAVAMEFGGNAIIDEDLVNEVAALVEWPIAIAGEFDQEYLSVPAEALIKTMQDNQKYFPVVDKNGNLKNCFITISNIDSKTPEKVKAGNERVVRPRLADARFFWVQDLKNPLESHLLSLGKVIFQTKLGSIGDKTDRITLLADYIADKINGDKLLVSRAATLCKCDLMTEMVGEFPSLQGIMGKRYAEVAGENAEVALALEEQYKPGHAGDSLPTTATGQAIAIADRLDTLVGIFAIGEKPTGVKDPYALRRATLGVLRIIIECELDLDLRKLVEQASVGLKEKVDASKVIDEVLDYMFERLRAYYIDNNVSVDVFDAVLALHPERPLDFDKRVRAVNAFKRLPEADSLAAANKRVRNILKKAKQKTETKVNKKLFEEKSETELYDRIQLLEANVGGLFDNGEYEQALCELSALRKPVDDFFDNVMVMTDDEVIRNNRIALLAQMSSLFLRAADLSRLQS